MLPLKQFRSKKPGLPDLLNWGFVIDDGIVLCKDGSLLGGWFYRGADLDSSPDSELNRASDLVNAALSVMGGGWTINVDSVRMPAPGYFPRETSHFPDPVSALIDEERRNHFISSGQHFETEYAITVNYIPPTRAKGKLADLVYTGEDEEDYSPAKKLLESFKHKLDEIERALSSVLDMRRMKQYTDIDINGKRHLRCSLVNYLHYTVTFQNGALNLPDGPCYMDTFVGGKEFYPSITPLVGDTFLAVVAIMGTPQKSTPGILAALDMMQMPLRFSSRYIFVEGPEARRQLRSTERKWKQRLRGFWAEVFRLPSPRVDEDAKKMADEATEAMSRSNSGLVATGYYTPTIVLSAPTAREAAEYARKVESTLFNLGFAARVETLNAPEAWLGSLPAHTVPNVRRPVMHTDNLADLLPLTSVWTGSAICPNPYYPPDSPALLQAATNGAAPFWLTLSWQDISHVLIFGPTASGKSTLLALILAQALRYLGVTIWAFDKGRTGMAMAKACRGKHYDIGNGDLAFCPLAVLDTNADVAWAEGWICDIFFLQHNQAVVPEEREAIFQALTRMRASSGHRSLTVFWAECQNDRVREAIKPYTVGGPMGHILDAEQDGLRDGRLIMFEIDELMGMGPAKLIPVLLYLFRRFERQLRGQPAFLLLDEAWIMLAHTVFREKIQEWLRTLRKANCGVIMATQLVSDAANSGIMDVLVESCKTKIFLPNSEATTIGTDETPGPARHYLNMGMNEAQLATIAEATPKKDYYVVTPDGCRLIDLQLGPIALSFMGAGSMQQIRRINELERRYGEEWPAEWLRESGQASAVPKLLEHVNA